MGVVFWRSSVGLALFGLAGVSPDMGSWLRAYLQILLDALFRMLCEDLYYLVLWVLKFLDKVIQVLAISCAVSDGVASRFFLIGGLPGTVSLHGVGFFWAG